MCTRNGDVFWLKALELYKVWCTIVVIKKSVVFASNVVRRAGIVVFSVAYGWVKAVTHEMYLLLLYQIMKIADSNNSKCLYTVTFGHQRRQIVHCLLIFVGSVAKRRFETSVKE